MTVRQKYAADPLGYTICHIKLDMMSNPALNFGALYEWESHVFVHCHYITDICIYDRCE